MKKIACLSVWMIAAFLTGAALGPFGPSGCCRSGDEPRGVRRLGEQHWASPTNLADTIIIDYVGDLILLRDAVEYGRRSGGGYSFDDMFRWMTPYWKSDDLTLAVFEGPMAGSDCGYTTSDFDDGIPLTLNFPDRFGEAVARAGIDFVSTANNHLLDHGTHGVFRTLDKLDEFKILHDGSFRNQTERETVKIVTVRGMRIAVLCYTSGCNGFTDEEFFDDETSFLTRPLVTLDSEFLKENIRHVEEDLRKARAMAPDAVIVMAHMGGQFLHLPDASQRFWNDFFVNHGVDIVLGDHSHSTQPVEWRSAADGHRTLIVNCPGNFVNSYAPHDGDASYMARLYLDAKSAKPIACGVVPLYGYGERDGNFAAVPVYDALTNRQFVASLSRNDFRRLQDVCRVVTLSAFGCRVELANAQPEYVITPDSRVHCPPIAGSFVITNAVLTAAESICFVGDSLTEGTKSCGVGWYEPLLTGLKGCEIQRFAQGSKTSAWFASKRSAIASLGADVYVCAFGCNDIRYRDPSVCAMDESEYVRHVGLLVAEIRRVNPKAVVVFVAPWISLDHDSNWGGTLVEKEALYQRYTAALREYCRGRGCRFVDPNPYLKRELSRLRSGEFMVDSIHPGSALGCPLYARSVLESPWE